jgi:hypothetical protein
LDEGSHQRRPATTEESTMTQYLLAVYGNEAELAQTPPEAMRQAFDQVNAFNAEVSAAGAWVFANGLHPSSTATVVQEVNGEVVTTDGPYTETKEVLGGFWIIEAPDLDAALGWARKATVACMGPVEVRPFQDL